MKISRKILAAALFMLAALPALAGTKQGAEFDCGWVQALKITNPTLLAHLHKILASDFECFANGDMKGISARNIDLIFDLENKEATLMLENGKQIITLPFNEPAVAAVAPVAPIAAVRGTRYLILLGGGGEPADHKGTVFDPALTALDSYLRTNEWKSVLSFGGGHADTDAILNNGFPDAINKSSFTTNNYEVIIRSFEEQIKTGKRKPGDQLLFMIASQGALKRDAKQLTHSVAVGAAGALGDSNRSVSLDAFNGLAALAKENNVGLAIIDFSSHSGSTLALANEDVCVASSSGPSHVSSAAFAENFIAAMKPGNSLEQTFLDARIHTRAAFFPMISTRVGMALNRDFYPALTPYLYPYDSAPQRALLNSYLIEASSDEGLTRRTGEYQDLLEKLTALRTVPDTTPIKNLLAEYKARQDRYLQFERALGVHELNRREMFVGTAELGQHSYSKKSTYSWRELLALDSDFIIKNLTAAKHSSRDLPFQTEIQASINLFEKIRARIKQLLETYPKLRDYQQKLDAQMAKDNVGSDFARKIAAEEKLIYDSIYRNYPVKPSDPNACRDFVL